jgi:GntR family transcriptional regulator, galactonate operon transcriptional repressor
MGRSGRLRASHSTVVDTIAGWVVGGRYSSGASLPIESAICAELNASRTVVREALKTLAAKGMVRIAPRTGTQVRPPDHWSLLDPTVVRWRLQRTLTPDFFVDLVEMRLLIEPPAAALAARKATASDVAAIREGYQRMEEAVEGRDSYIEADLMFHRSILKAAHNQFLTQLDPVIGAMLRLSFELSVTSAETARASLPNHAKLLHAIASGNARLAQSHTERIISEARADIERSLAKGKRRSVRA